MLLSVDYLGDPRHPGPEFTTFRKLDRPVISTTASLDQLRACFPTGLIVAEHGQWRTPWSVTSGVADYIETALDPVHLSTIHAPARLSLAHLRARQHRRLREDSRNRPSMMRTHSMQVR